MAYASKELQTLPGLCTQSARCMAASWALSAFSPGVNSSQNLNAAFRAVWESAASNLLKENLRLQP